MLLSTLFLLCSPLLTIYTIPWATHTPHLPDTWHWPLMLFYHLPAVCVSFLLTYYHCLAFDVLMIHSVAVTTFWYSVYFCWALCDDAFVPPLLQRKWPHYRCWFWWPLYILTFCCSCSTWLSTNSLLLVYSVMFLFSSTVVLLLWLFSISTPSFVSAFCSRYVLVFVLLCYFVTAVSAHWPLCAISTILTFPMSTILHSYSSILLPIRVHSWKWCIHISDAFYTFSCCWWSLITYDDDAFCWPCWLISFLLSTHTWWCYILDVCVWPALWPLCNVWPLLTLLHRGTLCIDASAAFSTLQALCSDDPGDLCWKYIACDHIVWYLQCQWCSLWFWVYLCIQWVSRDPDLHSGEITTLEVFWYCYSSLSIVVDTHDISLMVTIVQYCWHFFFPFFYC